MPSYKVVDAEKLDAKFKAIADSIRGKTGKTDFISEDDMPSEIDSIASGGDTSIEDGLIEGNLLEYTNDRVTSLRPHAFDSMDSIERISLPNVETIESFTFQNCKKLTYINMPKLTTMTTNAQANFSACESLQNVDFPLLKKADSRTFEYCKSLKNVNIPSVTYLGSNSFSGCVALTELVLPAVEECYTGCFSNCTSLRTVDFYSTVDFKRAGLFKGCTVLDAVILRSEGICPLSYTDIFDNTPIASGTGYIYVKKALIEDYKVATNWVTFANQFRAIEDYPEICGGAE